jgi:uncharacterized protein (DUF305 family)
MIRRPNSRHWNRRRLVAYIVVRTVVMSRDLRYNSLLPDHGDMQVKNLRSWCAAVLLATVQHVMAQEVPLMQPGAPGKATRALSATEAVKVAITSYSADDERFMRDMIPHHQQAVEMAAMVKGHSNTQGLVDAAGRIDAAQADEIRFMTDWLSQRGLAAVDPHAGHNMSAMAMPGMNKGVTRPGAGAMGMATPEQMAELAKASGVEFDRQFLTLMIAHHTGAVDMADHLLKQPGSAHDPVLFEFINDLKNEQTAEISRMNLMLNSLSTDSRANLKAGFRDAGEAIWNLQHVAALPKPAGFFDPNNPAGLPPEKPRKEGEKVEPKAAEPESPQDDARSPLLSFTNSDMAFKGDLLFAGNYHGFNVYRLDKAGVPKLLGSVVCPGGQGDVSVVGDILIMSVEQTRGRVDCGLQGIAKDVSPERFRGIRIFDIKDPARPQQVGQVQTCRGSHTHSVVSANTNGNIIVYNSGTAVVRDDREMAGCVSGPGDMRTSLFSIDVIAIPIADPASARIIESPRVFADMASGNLAGLWKGGTHGEGTNETKATDQCHDITVFPSLGYAAGACSGNGILFDIKDPMHPKRIDVVSDPGFAYWHSATFNNDGTKVIFTDEWGGGGRPRCLASDPRNWGADAIYDIVDGKLVFRSHYKLPAPQSDKENCVAHNGSIVPVPGRDLFVQAWYQGGISVLDFTDSARPVEIAYFDRGPINADKLVGGGFWSAYWYEGRIYGTEMVRGLDVLALAPSEHLTQDEIDAAVLAEHRNVFNPQDQFPVTWPASPAVAKAYLAGLERASAVPPTLQAAKAALDSAARLLAAGGKDAALSRRLDEFAQAAKTADGDAGTRKRLQALASTLDGIAARLR